MEVYGNPDYCDGRGDGNGRGDGSGSSDGEGWGDGWGCGWGSGSGDGYGNGSGDGGGWADGGGWGDGWGYYANRVFVLPMDRDGAGIPTHALDPVSVGGEVNEEEEAIIRDHFFMADPHHPNQCRVHVPVMEAGRVVGTCCGYPAAAHQSTSEKARQGEGR